MDELTEVQDIGEIVAQSVIEFFKQEKINNSIKEIMSLGVKPYYNEIAPDMNLLNGKTVVVTGSLVNYTRQEIKEKLHSLGANDASSVSRKTDFVLVGNDPGSKYDKALELGIKIITESEFEKMILK